MFLQIVLLLQVFPAIQVSVNFGRHLHITQMCIVVQQSTRKLHFPRQSPSTIGHTQQEPLHLILWSTRGSSRLNTIRWSREQPARMLKKFKTLHSSKRPTAIKNLSPSGSRLLRREAMMRIRVSATRCETRNLFSLSTIQKSQPQTQTTSRATDQRSESDLLLLPAA